MNDCKLTLHPTKTKIVYCKNYNHKEKHKHNSFDFLGYTFKPSWCKTKKHGFKLLMNLSISQSSESKILDEIRKLRLHKWTGKLHELVKVLNPKIRGWLNYYGRFSSRGMVKMWYILNQRLIKWVKWNKGYFVYRSLRWLRRIYAREQNLFVHWSYVKP